MAGLSVVKVRQFIAAVVAIVAGVVILAIAAAMLGWDIPGLNIITDTLGIGPAQ